MTPAIGGGGNNPLSRVSIAALADQGYQVNLGAADPFNSVDGSCQCRRLVGENGEEIVLPPAPKRKLQEPSEAQKLAANDAYSYGLAILQERAFIADDTELEDGVIYVGGLSVSVFYEDPDTLQVRSMIVRSS